MNRKTKGGLTPRAAAAQSGSDAGAMVFTRSGADILGKVLQLADQPLHRFVPPDFESALQSTQLSGGVAVRVLGPQRSEEFRARLIRIVV